MAPGQEAYSNNLGKSFQLQPQYFKALGKKVFNQKCIDSFSYLTIKHMFI